MNKHRWDHLPDREGHLFVGVAIIIAAIIITMLASVAFSQPSIPFAYDPNLCQGEVMDWAYSEPNEVVIYSTSFWSPGRQDPNGLNLWVDEGNGFVDFNLQYRGEFADPNGGWLYGWTFSWVPRAIGIQHVNLHVIYEHPSFTNSWSLPQGRDYKTILLNVMGPKYPHLRPGPPPSALTVGQGHFQWLRKQQIAPSGVVAYKVLR